VVRPDDDTPTPRQRQQAEDEALQIEVDRLLEKISRSGEASLTPKERETLTRASERFKQRSR
jgi:FtsZ-binding cell division protein ZapB